MTKFREAGPGDKLRHTEHGPVLSIQVLRGIASIAVVIYHTHLILANPQYGAIDVFGGLAAKGWLGVNLFFIISGFIILFAHFDQLGKPEEIASYIWKRFSRVYPVYWIFLSLYIVAALFRFGHADFSWDFWNLASAYALFKLTDQISLPLAVAWTLLYEVLFYVAFLAFFIHVRAGIALFAIWQACVLVFGLKYGGLGPNYLQVWNCYFVVGMGAYLLFRRLRPDFGLPIFLAGFLSTIAMVWAFTGDRIGQMVDQPLLLLLLAFPFAAIVLGSALMEKKYRWKPADFLLLIGAASYSIYLVHSAVISAIAIINHHFAIGVLNPYFLFAATATISTAVGVASHLIVERPVISLLRQWLQTYKQSSAARQQRAG
jgi:peptidoglycan/LPS O-acetylase OafA/YrhL